MKIPLFNSWLPPQTSPIIPKEWRADVALIASVFGAIAFTSFSAVLVYIMWKGGWPIETASVRIEVLSKALMLSLSGSLVVLITLGFAINKRSIKISKEGLEADGGDDDDGSVTTASVTTAFQISTPNHASKIDTDPAPSTDTHPSAGSTDPSAGSTNADGTSSEPEK